MISHHNFFQNVLLSDRCDLSAPVSWLLFHHDCDDLAEFSRLCGTWFYFCGEEAWMQESADKHRGMLGPLPHLGGDRNLLLYLIYRTITIGEYVCVFISAWHTCVLVCFGITEAGSGAAVHPEAPQCLHLQPYTPPDSTFTGLSSWRLPHLSLPSGLAVRLHLLLLKPHRVRDLLKAHTHRPKSSLLIMQRIITVMD